MCTWANLQHLTMSTNRSDKRKKKKYYMSAKKHKTGALEAGLKGFLITCNNECQCVKESYNLLNEFADNLYGSEMESTTTDGASKDMNIEEELAKEIESMKSKTRRFQQMRTMVKGIIFISTTVPDPIHLATSIFENVLQTGQRRTRFIFKMQPIVITCKASQSDIRKHLDEYLEEFTKDPKNAELSHKVCSNIRHNTNVTTSHILWYVRESVEKCAPKWTVNLSEPQLVILVYVLKTICCIGILKNYAMYKKYNLSELATCGNDSQIRKSENLPKELNACVNPTERNDSECSEEATTCTDDSQVGKSQAEPEMIPNKSDAIPTKKNDSDCNDSHSSEAETCVEQKIHDK